MNQQPTLDRDQAYARIRDLIVSGALDNDQPLSERGLAENLGLGRTPVREALKTLARDGLLQIVPMRGTFVRQLSLADLREIYQIRLALEGMAASLAAEHGPTDALRACAARLRALKRAAQPDVDRAQQAGWTFHDEIFRAAGNRRLAAIYETLRVQNGLALQKIRRYEPDRARQAVAEHLEIFEAIEARNPAEAQRRMWAHLAQALEARLRILASLGSIAHGEAKSAASHGNGASDPAAARAGRGAVHKRKKRRGF